jgi:tetratricopeptide (TPR) repeat protein
MRCSPCRQNVKDACYAARALCVCLGLTVSVFGQNPLVEQARQNPSDFQANHLAGEYYLKSNNLSAAIPFLEIAWKLQPANSTNGYDLALAYLQTGAKVKCRGVVDSLLKLSNTADAHNLLGDLEEAESHTDEAARQYEIAARMEPTEKNLFDLGSDLLKHSGLEPALKVFDYGVHQHPQSAKLRVGLGIAYYSLGQYDHAVETLCQAVDQDPHDTQALDFLGKMYNVSPHYAKEVAQRMALFAHNYPDNPAADYYFAISLRDRTSGATPAAEDQKAEALLLKAIKLNFRMTDAHYQLGLLYEDTLNVPKAIREYEIATQQRANFSQAHYRLARLYAKTGKTDLAAHEFALLKTLKESRQSGQ